MHWGQLWDRFVAGDGVAVEAIGTWATVVVAIVGAYFVWRQIRESRRLSVEQAQPDVVAMMESNPNQPQMIELAFKNFGATPARNIKITSDIPLQRTTFDGAVEPVWLPATIPYLAPGQEWRTTWDYAPKRIGSDLKDVDRHNITITFAGLPKTDRRTSCAVLDWGAYKGRRYLAQKSAHDGARALLAIDATLKKWTEDKHLRVLSRDGDKRDEEERAEIQAYLAERRAEDAAASASEAPERNSDLVAPGELDDVPAADDLGTRADS